MTSSVLDLGNFSTMVIDLPSADSTLLLKVQKDVNEIHMNRTAFKSCQNNDRC